MPEEVPEVEAMVGMGEVAAMGVLEVLVRVRWWDLVRSGMVALVVRV